MRIVLLALVVLAIAACGGKTVPTLPEKVVGHCTYTNPFSKSVECRDYVGEWTEDAATQQCKDQQSTVVLGGSCNLALYLGYCVLTNGDGKFTRITVPGDDVTKCAPSQRGCEIFGGGAWQPSAVCGGEVIDTGGAGLATFQQPTLNCVAPKAGEPAGQSDGGLVCTWEAISGATEPGRDFGDYASCDRVRTQRPYYASPPAPDASRDDPRLSDPAYAAELGWVKQEITATGCVCCHSTRAPKGPSNWYLESGPNFMNSFKERGLAFGAGWIDTIGFGSFAAGQNNGFYRPSPSHPGGSGFTTTDPARMARFFEAELAHRGVKRSDWPEHTYGGGPLDDQRIYQPGACQNGEGVGADGSITWRAGPARYVYVLEAGSANPTVPPNLDLPEGTLWRIDVPWTGEPMPQSSVKYGVVPAGAAQRLPASGSPPALVPGKTYYLYVLADIVVPITRCLFVAP